MKEVRNDTKALTGLQTKLRMMPCLLAGEVSISSTTEAISGLESEVEKLKSSLQTAQSNIEEKTSALAALEEAKAKAEEELAALRATLETLQSSSSDDSSKLAAVLLEVRINVFARNV